MVKKAGLLREVKIISRSIKILSVVGLMFALLVLFSYLNISKFSVNDLQSSLFNQKGFDVSIIVQDNTVPIILISNNETYVCEGNFIDFPVRVITLNGNIPEATLSIVNPFYITYYSKIDSITNEFRIVSATLSKDDAGGVNQGFKTYIESIFMSIGSKVASRNLNITVIERNNAPAIENIGVKTVWTRGENDEFNYQVNASDIEDGDSNSFNLSFNISFSGERLFNITKNGTMYFKPHPNDIGVHNISVCVSDNGLINPHPNITEVCGMDGSNLTSCNNFSLTVTNKNRPPIIVNHSPENLSLNILGSYEVYFNITSYDPDGTLVDVYWYVDETLKKYDSLVPQSDFSYSYICGFSGMSNITVVITDGEFNDSIKWNLSVSGVSCPSNPASGGGGGGGVACTEKWVCESWSECRNLQEDYNLRKLNYKTNTLISSRCKLFRWSENICGYQIRTCKDLKKCNSNISIPGTMKECYYVKNPGCSDGIKNCHNGTCEIGIDCGGSCPSCPSCDDGIKNQNEEGVDCGGVCNACVIEVAKKEFEFFKILMYISLIFLILALIGITILGIKYILLKKKLGDIYYEEKLGSVDTTNLNYRRTTSSQREI